MSSARDVIGATIRQHCYSSTLQEQAHAIIRALDAAGYAVVPKDDVMTTVAHLAAATSAYEKYAGNSERRSVRDPFFKTRLRDFQTATDGAREMARAMVAAAGSGK